MAKHKPPEPVKYYPDATWRLEWHKIPPDKLPASYKDYWLIFSRGRHVGDLFVGKSGVRVVLFERFTIRISDVKQAALIAVATILGPKH